MSASLKGYLPALSQLLEVTPAALYERQRALVRAGLIAQDAGHGPGSGVRATAPSVATLIISILATENLATAGERSRQIVEATPPDMPRCPLTGMKTFLDALSAILTSKNAARRVIEIVVSRTAAHALIKYKDGSSIRVSEFSGKKPNTTTIRVEAMLGGSAIVRIADDVRAMILSKFDEVEKGSEL
jgi:hypothetical protein